MALKDWVKLDRAFKYRTEWIKRLHGDESIIVLKTNFAGHHKNFWEVRYRDVGVSKILHMKLRTKSAALKYARDYMRKH